jgi:hypothetical protein
MINLNFQDIFPSVHRISSIPIQPHHPCICIRWHIVLKIWMVSRELIIPLIQNRRAIMCQRHPCICNLDIIIARLIVGPPAGATISRRRAPLPRDQLLEFFLIKRPALKESHIHNFPSRSILIHQRPNIKHPTRSEGNHESIQEINCITSRSR